MDEAYPGLREALTPNWRAGAFGVVLVGGTIAVGDPVTWTTRQRTDA
jgi:MOSC domain-containing protein YiiM